VFKVPVKIAINGFGRIGRLFARSVAKEKGMQIVAVNDIVEPDHLAYLFKYDSTHGRYQGQVESGDNTLIIDGNLIRVCMEKDPEKLPWKELDVDFVVESTGIFTSEEGAAKHLKAGAKRVIISAPAKGDIPTYVMGVNHTKYRPEHDRIVSNASCTTNCLAPITKVLLDSFGIEEGLMTTIHAVTSSQPTVDGPSKKDWRGGRSAPQNIIPSTTGAAKAVALCIPEVKGKLTGMAFRVPTADVSAVDLTVRISKDATFEEVSAAMKMAADGPMKGILAYTDEQVVSTDFLGDPHSAIFDSMASMALNKRFFKLVAWYDNEIGYATRIKDLIAYMASRE